MSIDVCAQVALSVWEPPDAILMVAIAGAESGWVPWVHGDHLSIFDTAEQDLYRPRACNGYLSHGFWQIFAGVHYGYLQAVTGSPDPCAWAWWAEDPWNNVSAAKRVWDSQGPSAWSAYNVGTYLGYYVDAENAVARQLGEEEPGHPQPSPGPTPVPPPPPETGEGSGAMVRAAFETAAGWTSWATDRLVDVLNWGQDRVRDASEGWRGLFRWLEDQLWWLPFDLNHHVFGNLAGAIDRIEGWGLWPFEMVRNWIWDRIDQGTGRYGWTQLLSNIGQINFDAWALLKLITPDWLEGWLEPKIGWIQARFAQFDDWVIDGWNNLRRELGEFIEAVGNAGREFAEALHQGAIDFTNDVRSEVLDHVNGFFAFWQDTLDWVWDNRAELAAFLDSPALWIWGKLLGILWGLVEDWLVRVWDGDQEVYSGP